MVESQKPFACTIEGCEMTFTNEDHLNWHHKKHDMVLNLGLANKTLEVADQTPTPTRFIRNCEEVGLFQDLQNVNPFDETFKKAIESGKSGSLHVPETTSSDDTLHTPHIFPHVEITSVNKYIDARNDNQSNDFCISSVPSNKDNNEPDESYDLTIDTEEPVKDPSNKRNELKNKLKETIKNKVKTPFVITCVSLERLKLSEGKAPKRAHASENSDDGGSKKQKSDEDVPDAKAKIRETNRAAQFRCRKRKQIQWKKMEEEIRSLKCENARLLHENQNFKHKLYSLKELLLTHKIAKDRPLLSKIEQILNASTPLPRRVSPLPRENKVPVSIRNSTKNVSKPLPLIQNVGQGDQKPVVIQVMGSVGQLAVSVVPNK